MEGTGHKLAHAMLLNRNRLRALSMKFVLSKMTQFFFGGGFEASVFVFSVKWSVRLCH